MRWMGRIGEGREREKEYSFGREEGEGLRHGEGVCVGGGKRESLEDRTILDHGNLLTLLRKILLMKQSGNV
jgi:hypothetical protein